MPILTRSVICEKKKNESAFISIILYITIHLQEAFGEEGMVVGRGSACLIGMTDYIHVVISIRVWVCVFVSSLRCGVVYTCWCVFLFLFVMMMMMHFMCVCSRNLRDLYVGKRVFGDGVIVACS